MNPNRKSGSSVLRSSALNVVGKEHYNPNRELEKEFDYERRDIKFAHEDNLIEKIRRGDDMKNGLLGSSTLMSDVERMKKAREQQSMVGRLKKEYIRELDNYKADLFKKDNIYISPDVGVSLVDNPFLIDGINSEQLNTLDPSKVEERMMQLKEKEEALAKVISKLPIDDELYENMMAELELVAKDRANAEKEYLEFKLREDPDFAMPEGAFNKRRERIRRKLLKALDFGEKGEKIKYDRFEGFYLWIDHIINVHRNFPITFLNFQVMDATGETQQLMQTMSKAMLKDNERYKRSFAERHRIYGVVPHNHTYIMFQFWVEEKFIQFDKNEFADLLKVEEKDPEFKYEKKMVVYGWCPLKIFHNEKLRVGRWKIPLYKTPIPPSMDPENLKAFSYLRYGTLFVRIGLPQEGNPAEILPADMAIRGYQQPGYLQEHILEPEMDEYFDSENEKIGKRTRQKELALHRKKILQKLMEREQKVRDEIKRLNDEKRQNELDAKKQKMLDDLEGERIQLEEERRILEDEYQKMKDDIRKAEIKKRERKENKKKIDEKRYGIRVTLLKLSGFSSFKTVKLVYGLYVENKEMHDDLGDLLQYETQSYKSPKKKRKGAKKAPKRIIKLKGEEELFVKNCRGLVLLNKGVRRVYLGFKILVFPRKKRRKRKILKDDEEEDPLADLPLPENEKPELLGWYFWEISGGSGKVKASSKKRVVYFWDPPLLKLPFEKTVLKKTTKKLEFKMEEFFYEMASLPFFAEMRLKGRKKKDKLRKIKPQKLVETWPDPFIPNNKQQWENRSFDKGSGIDIYIDSLRFLPDNVTTTKIIVRFVDSYMNDVIYPQAGLPVLESDMLNPEFNFRQELRAPNYDPTAMMYITYITVDARGDEKTPKVMGYSFLNLFVNKYEDGQPKSRSEKAYSVLNNGSYQIPIFCQPFKREFPFFVEDCNRYDKLPGSSALVRIRLAPRSANGTKVIGLKSKEVERIKEGPVRTEYLEKYGVWVKAVEYKFGTYNNELCRVGQTETELIESRTRRLAKPCINSAKGLMELFGTPLDENEGTKKDQEDKVIDFLDNYLILKSQTPFLNLKYFSKYTGLQGGQKGFKLSIDGVHNLPKKGYYFCLYSLNPPGDFYGENPDQASLRANSYFDWDQSTYQTIFYNESYSKYADIPFDPFAHFVVDVRSIKMYNNKPPEFKQVAWTVIPVFTEDGYVNSNIYQIPLFVGSPDPEMLKEMKKTSPWEYMKKSSLMKGNAGIKYWGKASIFCRLLDLQREGHFQNKFDFLRCVYEFIPKGQVKDYAFTYDSIKKMRRQTLLKKMDSYREDVVTFNKRLSDFIIEEYNIGATDGDSEDSFDDDDYWYEKKKNVYDEEDYFDKN